MDRETPQKWSTSFASRVFSLPLMKKYLPEKVFQNVERAMNGKEKLDLQYSNTIAKALKEWAIKLGATHYTHWFQPLTGAAAEKHDAFLSGSSPGSAIEQFRGKDLLRGEPDASSFPSGGLRATHEARGYTTWDPSSPPFIWEKTLFIPSIFFSWRGEALDYKIPLLRSDEKINRAALRLLKFCGVLGDRVFSTLGPEQEYFAIDRNLYLSRPDLLLAGRTVYGARPSKGQELEEHYFGAVKERILDFMREFEERAIELGIPVKTRHNEVAPAQYEIAPFFERSSLAVDHNVLLMELMRQTAVRHHLACLFHEKPFAFVNGSGKHCNWSLATDRGLNLLDPKENSLVFLILLTAVLHAVREHAGLLRASVASLGNDYRLGGSEAPPTILSVYLGASLERLVDEIIREKKPDRETLRQIDLGLAHIPRQEADPSDRNRTSFFAFTGNKFEFRAVGASANPAFPLSVINSIVADSLQLILDEIDDATGGKKKSSSAFPILGKHLKQSKVVLFSGSGYSPEWEKEAEKRGLPNIRKSFHAFAQLLNKKTARAFEGVLTEEEIHSRYEVFIERYAKEMEIEVNLMIELFRTQILPAALRDQKNRAEALAALRTVSPKSSPQQLAALKQLASLISEAAAAVDEIERMQNQTKGLGWEAKGKIFCELIAPKMAKARQIVDQLEALVDFAIWPLSKYRELLFLA